MKHTYKLQVYISYNMTVDLSNNEIGPTICNNNEAFCTISQPGMNGKLCYILRGVSFQRNYGAALVEEYNRVI